MLAFAIFAVTFVVALIFAVIYLYPGSSKPTTVPGLDPTTKEDGNMADIGIAGSLHEFLIDVHKQFGDIASFWMGQQQVISIASPQLFKEHQAVFDRPVELFKLFEPVIGTNAIVYANGSEGRARRHNYDKVFTYEALEGYYPKFQKVTDELIKKWNSSVNDEHIPLHQHMIAVAVKAALWLLVGRRFTDDKFIVEFRKNFDQAWSDMERRLSGDMPAESSSREKSFNEGVKKLHSMVKECLEDAKNSPAKDLLLLDVILNYTESSDIITSDIITYIIGAFHTTGNHLTWCFYFLATHKEVQEKLYQEVKSILGDGGSVTPENLNKLTYLRQVIDETFRCAVVGPWAARFQDFDSELGGHKIPKNTPVIQAIGVCMQDEKYWPLPKKFDPERFSEKNMKGIPTLAFSPFGFAGKRMCPAYRLSYVELSVVIAGLINKFEVDIVEGQVVKPVYGLNTHPEDEVWITVKKRKS